MPGISRRRFLRDASLGAAAAGALAVVGPQALGSVTASASPLHSGTASGHGTAPASTATGTNVMVHLVDDNSGTISLYSGTRKVTVRDRALAEALLKSAR